MAATTMSLTSLLLSKRCFSLARDFVLILLSAAGGNDLVRAIADAIPQLTGGAGSSLS
jgi:hypothetical protein